MSFAGDPAHICIDGISPFTTELAPIIVPDPIFVPGKITQFAPIHTSSPIEIELAVFPICFETLLLHISYLMLCNL